MVGDDWFLLNPIMLYSIGGGDAGDDGGDGGGVDGGSSRE